MEENRRASRHSVLKWTAILLLALPMAYVGWQLFSVLHHTYRTQTAVYDTMSDSLTCRAVLGMSESDVPYDGSGVLGYQAANGERVSAGQTVAQVFTSAANAQQSAYAQQLTQEIALLNKSQISGTGTDVEMLLKQTNLGVYDLLDVLERNELSGLAAARGQVQVSANKAQIAMGNETDYSQRIADLTAARDAALAAAGGTDITAPVSGYFVAGSDSTQRLYTTQQLTEMAPPDFASACLQETPANAATTAGKIIEDYNWSCFLSVTAKQAAKFTEGASVTHTFPSSATAESYPATVVTVTVDDASSTAKVELTCDYLSAAVVTQEHTSVQVAFQSYKGIRIPKEALRIVDGVNGVYVKQGNIAYFKPVTILFDGGDAFLVPEEVTKGQNEVELYDDVIVEGKDLSDGKVL